MPRRILSRPAYVALLLLGVVALCVAWAVLGERHPRSAVAPTEPVERARTTPDLAAAQFVGDRVCAGCHPGEFRDHTASNHARTLRPMRPEMLPKGFPHEARFVDRQTDLRYEMREEMGRYTLAAYSFSYVRRREMDFALGSGKGAISFVSQAGPRSLLELRMSYLPNQRKWFVTPGQNGPQEDPIGRLHEGTLAQRCLGCHATVLPESRLAPDERFMGVGCEACHGSGQVHAAAVRAGDAPRGIEGFHGWGGRRLNYLCGECHRTDQDVDPNNPTAVSQTQRMQPYGLMKSACYQKSGDRLSCLTCHNPHRNAETTPQSYERACRTCHGRSAQDKTCPVNPRDGCVRCHMPSRELLPGIEMADHWIRVYPKPGQGAKPTS
jgi:hypothetical protein